MKDGSATYGDGTYSWTLSELTSEQMVFSNEKFTFPKSITWLQLTNGHWYCLLKNDTQKVEYDIEPLHALNKAVDNWILKNKKS